MDPVAIKNQLIKFDRTECSNKVYKNKTNPRNVVNMIPTAIPQQSKKIELHLMFQKTKKCS